uniref:Uncharacterized protein n=1 Tax=Myotis myotis TaxID=51298 RepID=A0A7J7VI08_MYOMY|nr:hypothetical protein mMyoMyo1_008230 [Myotis myotis]
MRHSCEVMQAADRPYAFFQKLWGSLTQLQFDRFLGRERPGHSYAKASVYSLGGVVNWVGQGLRESPGWSKPQWLPVCSASEQSWGLCPAAPCRNKDHCKHLCEKAALTFQPNARLSSFSPYESGSPNSCPKLEFKQSGTCISCPIEKDNSVLSCQPLSRTPLYLHTSTPLHLLPDSVCFSLSL